VTFNDLLPFKYIVNEYVNDDYEYNDYKILSKLHTQYFNDYAKLKNIEVTNKQFYLMFGFSNEDLKLVDFHFNKHIDGANFRKIFEIYNITNYLIYDSNLKIFVTEVWDIGAGPRLAKSAICRVAVLPLLDEVDQLRNIKLSRYTRFTKVFNKTFSQVLVEYKDYIDLYQPYFNFTDSLYYINDLKLEKLKKYDGLIGFGTAHLFVKDGPLRVGQTEFGYVKSRLVNDTVYMMMQVFGNIKPYVHPQFFKELLNNSQCRLDIDDQNVLLIIRQDSVSFGATEYIRFTIQKLPVDYNLILSPIAKIENNDVPIIIGDKPYVNLKHSDHNGLYNIKLSQVTLAKICSVYSFLAAENKQVDVKTFCHTLLAKMVLSDFYYLPIVALAVHNQFDILTKNLKENESSD
jgi:hypothetical protein